MHPLCLLPVLLLTSVSAPAQTKATTPRAAVESFFTLLKAQKYEALYDFLPSEFQQQINREQLDQSLKRLNSFLLIEKLEISRVQEQKEFAVVDTIIYGRLKQPRVINEIEITEGRVNVQQFLFRENGRWKLATADNRSQSFFLKRNPDFNKQFQLTRPRFEFKQNGKWEMMGRRQ